MRVALRYPSGREALLRKVSAMAYLEGERANECLRRDSKPDIGVQSAAILIEKNAREAPGFATSRIDVFVKPFCAKNSVRLHLEWSR